MSRHLSTLALAASLAATPALAGGPVITPVEPEPVTPLATAPADQGYDWTGLHFGLFGSSASGTMSWADETPTESATADLSGSTYGLDAGFDWQMGRLVLGLGASASGGTIDGSAANGLAFDCGTGCNTSVDSLNTVYARVGLAMNRTLIYLVAGASRADVNATSTGFGGTDVSDTLSGSTYGLGLEQALGERMSVSLEALRTDLGRLDLGSSCGFNCYTDVSFDQVKLGVNFRW